MAKMFNFEWQRGEMVETDKAFGFAYSYNGIDVSKHNRLFTEWLPKSQITVTDVTREMYAEEYGDFTANHYWVEGIVWVSVPMWLARKHDYFKKLGFK